MTATDLRLLVRDGFARGALAIFVLSVALAAVLGHDWAERHRRGLIEQAANERYVIEEYPVAATRVDLPIILPAPALLDLTIGRTDLEPSAGQTNYWTRADQLFNGHEIPGPSALAAGRFDLAFVTIWLAPLLLIALGLSIASADRDAGLLRLAAASPRPLARTLLNRAAVRLAIVFAPVALAAAALVALSPPAPDKAARLALWLLAAFAYLALWQGAILFAATLRARQEAVGAALIGLWALVLLVVPALASAAASAAAPPPSRFALVADARAVEVATRDEAPDLVKRYMHDHPELMAGGADEVDAWMQNFAMINGRVEAAVAPTLARFDTAQARQRAVARGFEPASPALLAHRLLTDAAGSGEARFAVFRAAARDYHRKLKARLVYAGLRGAQLGPAEVAALPRFAMRERPPAIPLGAPALIAAAALLTAAALRRATPRTAL